MEQKPLMLYIAPVQSRSGYGEHSRDILRSLIKINKYDIKVMPIRWGNTPLNALKPEIDDDILSLILIKPELPKKPDISVQLTVPNEFNNSIANFNIGITAGIETNMCSVAWIEGMNRMHLNIVPSTFSKNVFQQTVYTQTDQKGNPVSEVKCIKPIHVLFEGVDTNIYGKDHPIPKSIKTVFSEISEDFTFLFVGHWLQGELGADRKDVGMLVKIFLQTFKNKPFPPALVLKTGSTFSHIDRHDVLNKINSIKSTIDGKLPNIYLIFGDLTPQEMNGLYIHPKVKAHISFTKGEGFGRPLLEASLSEKPIIVGSFGGQTDFLPANKTILLPGKIEPVHPSAVWNGVIEKEAKWFNVNYQFASNVMLNVATKSYLYRENAKSLAKENTQMFSFDKMTEELEKIINEHVPTFAVKKTLNIPVLTKLKPLNKEKKDEISTQDNKNNS